jgi:hypothetical protein
VRNLFVLAVFLAVSQASAADPTAPSTHTVRIAAAQPRARLIARISARVLTVGEEEFREADRLARAGKTKEAIAVFEKLRTEYRGSWIDRAAADRLAKLRLR